MKLLKSYLLLSIVAAGSFMIMSAQDEEDVDVGEVEVVDTSAQLRKHKNQLRAEHRALRKLIETAAPKEVTKLQTALEAIQEIEGTNGIDEIQGQMAQLRFDSCKKQQSDEEIKALVDESMAKVKEIEELTKMEQQKVDELTKKMGNLTTDGKDKDDPEVKKLQEELKDIQKQMREKTADQLAVIEENNDQIYAKMPTHMEKGRKHMKQLKEKYEAIKDEIDPHDKKVAEATQNIEKALEKHKDKLEKIRTNIKDLRSKIYKLDPCFSAKESLKDLDKSDKWEQLFIS